MSDCDPCDDPCSPDCPPTPAPCPLLKEVASLKAVRGSDELNCERRLKNKPYSLLHQRAEGDSRFADGSAEDTVDMRNLQEYDECPEFVGAFIAGLWGKVPLETLLQCFENLCTWEDLADLSENFHLTGIENIDPFDPDAKRCLGKIVPRDVDTGVEGEGGDYTAIATWILDCATGLPTGEIKYQRPTCANEEGLYSVHFRPRKVCCEGGGEVTALDMVYRDVPIGEKDLILSTMSILPPDTELGIGGNPEEADVFIPFLVKGEKTICGETVETMEFQYRPRVEDKPRNCFDLENLSTESCDPAKQVVAQYDAENECYKLYLYDPNDLIYSLKGTKEDLFFDSVVYANANFNTWLTSAGYAGDLTKVPARYPYSFQRYSTLYGYGEVPAGGATEFTPGEWLIDASTLDAPTERMSFPYHAIGFDITGALPNYYSADDLTAAFLAGNPAGYPWADNAGTVDEKRIQPVIISQHVLDTSGCDKLYELTLTSVMSRSDDPIRADMADPIVPGALDAQEAWTRTGSIWWRWRGVGHANPSVNAWHYTPNNNDTALSNQSEFGYNMIPTTYSSDGTLRHFLFTETTDYPDTIEVEAYYVANSYTDQAHSLAELHSNHGQSLFTTIREAVI